MSHLRSVPEPAPLLTSGPVDQPHPSGHRHRLAGLLLLAFGLVMAWQSTLLGVGELLRPQPGLWPLLLSVIVCVCALVLVVVDRADDYEPWSRRSLLVVGGVASLAVFVLAFQMLGFLVSAALLLVLWLRVFGGESWRWTIGLSLLGAVGFHLLFSTLLGVPFPAGLIQL